MKYFLDTEFLEGPQRKRIFGVPALGLRWDETGHAEIYRPYAKPTIDLISIGIVAEDGREYYAISKDFNLKEAWNRFDEKVVEIDYGFNTKSEIRKAYWLRENVLKPIFIELTTEHILDGMDFTYSNLKKLILKYGKTNKQIAKEIIYFTEPMYRSYSLEAKDRFTHGSVYYGIEAPDIEQVVARGLKFDYPPSNPEFYAYYADYDWVVFCWLFGKMIDLPAGFPMYCMDLKQMLDEKAKSKIKDYCFGDTEEEKNRMIERSIPGQVESFKTFQNYPKQENEHNALADSRWNKKLYEFLNNIK